MRLGDEAVGGLRIALEFGADQGRTVRGVGQRAPHTHVAKGHMPSVKAQVRGADAGRTTLLVVRLILQQRQQDGRDDPLRQIRRARPEPKRARVVVAHRHEAHAFTGHAPPVPVRVGPQREASRNALHHLVRPRAHSRLTVHVTHPARPVFLLQARKARRLSQLELSLRLGVSQRHVSFVECGRARPGRELLLEWLRELDVPLSLRNETMLKAGYAPAYSASRLDAPELAQANEALVQLLRAHDPKPAMVMDAEWNVLHMNRGGVWLAMTLMPWAAGLPAGTPFNMLDLLAHPEGFTRSMVNLPEVAPAMLQRLGDETARRSCLRLPSPPHH